MPRRLRGFGPSALEVEAEAVRVVDVDNDLATALEASEEHLVRQRILELLLDQAIQRPGTEDRVVALLGQTLSGRRAKLDRDLPLAKLRFELENELVDHALHHLGRQRIEANDLVETVSELGTEDLLELLTPVAAARFREADGLRRHLSRTGI